MPEPATIHRTATRVLSVLLLLLGVALLISTVARGGGLLSVGVLFGVTLGGAGAARLWLERARGDA